MKYLLIIPIAIIPFIVLAWNKPTLTSQCNNQITITLSKEKDYIIEFSGSDTFDSYTTVDFHNEGTHIMYLSVGNTIYARYASDRKVVVSAERKICETEVKKSTKKVRKHKSGYIRKWTPPVTETPVDPYKLYGIPKVDCTKMQCKG